MAITQSTKVTRAVFLGRIAESWEKRPDLSFGELLAAAIDDSALGIMSDAEIAHAIERFLLLGSGSATTRGG